MKYLYNDLHELAWRIDGDKTYAKMKDGAETLDERDSKGRTSIALTDALIENHEITKAEYDAF